MSIKENVDYVKEELNSQEKFLESFVKGERFYKKYRTLIFASIAIIVIGAIGLVIKKNGNVITVCELSNFSLITSEKLFTVINIKNIIINFFKDYTSFYFI